MRIEHRGNAKITTTTAELGDTGSDLVINIADPAGWPDGSIGLFYVSLNKGTINEEKVLCVSRAGSAVQVWTSGPDNGRGADGTTVKVHPINSTVEHIWTATEADAANAHIETTTGAHGYPPAADVVTLDGAQTITGQKTHTAPILHDPIASDGTWVGGTHTDATHMSVIGAQAEAEFRVRNTYIGTGVPDNALGSDGDLFISKA